MSNEVATYEDMSKDQLLALMSNGSDNNSNQDNSDLLPLLKINYEEEDQDGNELRKGLWTLTNQEVASYAKEVTFRALGDFMQYLHYDEDKEEVVNRTIIHRAGDEPLDEKGTLRCGRPIGREFHAMEESEKKRFKGITCFRYLYGIVSYKGETATGEEVQVDNMPCLLRQKGASFMAFSDQVIQAARSRNVNFQQVTSTIGTKRNKKGSVTYFTPVFTPDMSNLVELSDQDIATMKRVLGMIKAVNEGVIAKHNESLKSKQDDSDVLDSVSEVLDAEFVDDDIDF